ncbi:hypothetical protein ACFQE8_19255 [Salinirubellus sp. GCM10025818]|uniref:hypothetical protein n=1 Tax=Salinirubellus TaxID=2162630 RepID=UPI0030CE432B
MSPSADEMRSTIRRPEENAVMRWVLLTAPRWQVLLVTMFAVYAGLVALGFVNPLEMRDLLDETNAAKTLFSALLSGAILLVSVVVSINSVVLSQEMTDLEDQQTRIDASMDYHREIEEYIEAEITPARPADFLSAVLYALSTQMVRLTEIAADSPDEEFRADVEEFADSVAGEIADARTTLSEARMGSFRVLLAGLNYNYSGELHAARGLRHRYGDDLSEEAQDAIGELISTLKHIGTGREYFKSLYYKRELAYLSSRLLFVSLPVIVFTSYVILALDASLFPEIVIFGLSPLVLFVLLAYTIALAPYILLTVYVIRAATITIRTLAGGPFILQEGSEIESLEWDPDTPSREWELSERTERK